MAIADTNEDIIAKSMQNKWLEFGIKSRYEILSIDHLGGECFIHGEKCKLFQRSFPFCKSAHPSYGFLSCGHRFNW